LLKKSGLLMNLSLLTVAQVVAQLLNLVALVFLARYLGDYWFGVVQVGVAVSAYALITAEWGLNSLGIRDISRFANNPQKILAYARIHQGLLAGMAFIVFFGFIFILPLFPFYQHDGLLFLFYVALVFPQIISLEWLGIGLERMGRVGTAKALASIFYTSFILIFLARLDGVWGWPNYRWVPLIYLTSFFLANLFLINPARKWAGGVTITPRWPSRNDVKERVSATAPIGASILVMRVLMNGDMIMLGILSRPEVAGQYAASAKIGFLMVIAMEVLWKALLPRLSRLAGVSKAAFGKRFQLFLGSVIAVLGPAVVIALTAGPRLIVLIYGQKYDGGGLIFQILALSYTLFSLAWFLGNSLIATDRQREFFPPLVVSVIVAITANLILVPIMDGLGAALSMLASHTVLLVIMVFVCRSWFEREVMRALGIVSMGMIAMGLIVLALSSMGVILQVLAGMLVYGLVIGWPLKNWVFEMRK
jgi:O-antigen/teichoic acid export membrane protein